MKDKHLANPLPTEEGQQLAALNVIRTETAFSRYPVHALSKKGVVDIEITEKDDRGATVFKWEVSYNSRYGQPNQLAYKIDTIVINRRIDEAERPLPQLIKLGSLLSLCHEFGLADSGKNRNNIKQALYQNAFAAINAKVNYVGRDRSSRTIEFGSTRYAVIFTGERLPDGRRADAVYILLHELYRELLETAMRRPLDYDYLKALAPAAQRFYELVSYQVYAAIRHGRPRAKLAYSEFCTYGPQTRYHDFDHVKKQMWKVLSPHRESGYVERIDYEATVDGEGLPDWEMALTPGPRARREYEVFSRRGLLTRGDADASQTIPAVVSKAGGEPRPANATRARKSGTAKGGAKAAAVGQARSIAPPLGSAQEDSLKSLIEHGVIEKTARDLVAAKPEVVRNQLAWLSQRKYSDAGAFLVEAIRNDYAAPTTVKRKQEQERQKEVKSARETCEFCHGRGTRYVDERMASVRRCTHDPEQESKYPILV